MPGLIGDLTTRAQGSVNDRRGDGGNAAGAIRMPRRRHDGSRNHHDLDARAALRNAYTRTLVPSFGRGEAVVVTTGAVGDVGLVRRARG